MSVIDGISLYAIAAIWILMILNMVLSVGGFIYYMKVYETDGRIPLKEYPFVSVMIPAHNEGIVIQKTVKALMKFQYPEDRYEVIVINDNSMDDSADILAGMQKDYGEHRLIVINTDAVTGGKGKSNALNIGLKKAKGSVLAIYDADNTPAPDALILLVENLMSDDKLGAVIGKFRTRNKHASILTRFVNIETLAYQCMNQAGRYFFFKLCTIPGTNFVIRRKIVEEMGGWDTKALSEDTEISFRIYRMGYYIKMMPLAVTWEQEPHLLKVWFKQRTRWAKGNVYVLVKNFKYVFDRSAGPMRLDVLYYALVYILMLSALVCSDTIFFLGVLGYVHVSLAGFSTVLWGMAILLFVVNIMVTLASEKNEFNLISAALVFLMLFTYAKLWVLVVLRAIWMSIEDAVLKREVKWDKTVRYAEASKDVVEIEESGRNRKKKKGKNYE